MEAKWIGIYAVVFIFTLYRCFALECYTCSSAEDSECATKPGQQIDVEECVNANDECVTVVAAGITRRGCLLSLFPNQYCAEPCDRCNTSLCNRNVFPVDRLRCYQCVGPDCLNVTEKASLLLPCPFYHIEDRCYMNVIGIGNVQRGCERTNLPPTCPNVCLKCNYNGCNSEEGVREESCIECSHNAQTSPNPDCLRSQDPTPAGSTCAISPLKHCNNKIMYGHRAQCFTHVNEQTGVVRRGCSTNMGFYPTGTLTQCYGVNCNTDCLTIGCNNCTSTSDDPNCRLGRNLRSQKCSDGTISCYSCEEGAQLRRGCVDDIFQPSATEACYECRESDGCNRMPIRTCYHCSSLDNPDCGLWTNEENIERRNCSTSAELCVSTQLSKLNLIFTVRGCSLDIPECSGNDPFCVRCNGSLCNTQPMLWQFGSGNRQLGMSSHQSYHLWDSRSGQATQRQMTKPIFLLGFLCVLFLAGKQNVFLV